MRSESELGLYDKRSSLQNGLLKGYPIQNNSHTGDLDWWRYLGFVYRFGFF